MAGSAVERSAEAIAEMAARPNAAAVVTQARAVVTAMAAAEAIGCGWAGGAERRRLELDWSGGDARWRRRKRRRRWWWPRSSDGGEGDGDGGDGNGTLDAVRGRLPTSKAEVQPRVSDKRWDGPRGGGGEDVKGT